MPDTLVKSESGLRDRVISELEKLPGGDHIKMCIQCGTCSGGCPVVETMDYTPREIFALLRGGYIDIALKCNTQWQCISCYLCTVRCPAKIKITETFYALRYLAQKEKMVPKNFKPYILMKRFNDIIRMFGRGWEMGLMMAYYIPVSPLTMVGMIGFAQKMFFRGRLPIFPSSAKGLDDLKKILNQVETGEVK